MFSKTFLAAAFAAVAAAQNSNPTITPATGESVDGCVPFELKWTPTSAGTVSIEIITGPSQAALEPVGFVANGIANTGSFTWTPAETLSANAITGYKIYIDGSPTGEFQYSVPFSVNKGECAKADEPAPAPVPEPSATVTASKEESYPTATSSVPFPTETSVIVVPSSSCTSTSTSTVYVQPPSTGYPTAPAPQYPSAPYPSGPASTLYPTASAPLPSGTGSVSYPTPPAQEFPGAASASKAGLGLVGAAAAFIFML